MKKKTAPRIMYIGPLDRGGSCYSRMSALADLGVEVIPFDTKFVTHTHPYKLNFPFLQSNSTFLNTVVLWRCALAERLQQAQSSSQLSHILHFPPH